ncbi:DUF3822 family protein [Polluticaenibacter yanchengensis]|uniref:DUF3822 family protein n=1 Tax=Polluticaenibacter yanchengensis TaxID=3014562 RepID=A0ABT4UIW2_9BACT|nr:DUF3822 family protein [Chitinophagaceae bacterium LY-5]
MNSNIVLYIGREQIKFGIESNESAAVHWMGNEKLTDDFQLKTALSTYKELAGKDQPVKVIVSQKLVTAIPQFLFSLTDAQKYLELLNDDTYTLHFASNIVREEAMVLFWAINDKLYKQISGYYTQVSYVHNLFYLIENNKTAQRSLIIDADINGASIVLLFDKKLQYCNYLPLQTALEIKYFVLNLLQQYEQNASTFELILTTENDTVLSNWESVTGFFNENKAEVSA